MLRHIKSNDLTIAFISFSTLLCHLAVRFHYRMLCVFKGPRGLQGPTGPTGKAGKRVRIGKICSCCELVVFDCGMTLKKQKGDIHNTSATLLLKYSGKVKLKGCTQEAHCSLSNHAPDFP